MRADDYIAAILRNGNIELGAHLSSDVLLIKSPIRFSLDQAIRHEIESLHDEPAKRQDRLTVLIETTGGNIEVVGRIYNVFHKHYSYVEYIVPDFAYSAGTILVLSGDEIYMDYYSILGPIDPQYKNDDGRLLPGLGYLQKFDDIVAVVNAAGDPDEVSAQLADGIHTAAGSACAS